MRTLLFALALTLVTALSASAQPVFTKAFSPSTIGPGSVSTLTFTIDNSAGAPISDVAFTDNLPAGVTIATPGSVSNDCLASVSAPDGGSTITASIDRFGGGTVCTITVDVTSSTVGVHNNVSGDLTSSAGNSGTAQAVLTVDANRPGFSKSFAPTEVSVGGASRLTLTIDNTANGGNVSNIFFTDNLPKGIVVATPANLANTCIGSPTATAGNSSISFVAGSVSAGATCTIAVDVTATQAGTFVNRTSDLSSTAGSSGMALATLEATLGVLNKTFTDDPVAPGGTVTLQFTLTNLERGNTLSNIAFTDDLDATLTGLVATGLPQSNVCGAGSSILGTSTLSFTGGSLGDGEDCTFSVTLQVPADATPGTYPNTTSTVSADVTPSEGEGDGRRNRISTYPAATDNLVVAPVPTLTKTFLDDPVVAGATTTVEFTITNTSTTHSATDLAFSDELSAFLGGTTASSLPAVGFCGGGSSIIEAVDVPSAGDRTLFMTGGSLAPGADCTFQVDLDIPDGVTGGNYTNTTSAITGTVDGSGQTGDAASDDLTVVSAPRLTKSFTDDPVLAGGTVTLAFTLQYDENDPFAATDIAFTDDLDAVLTGLVATGLPQTNVCGEGSEIDGTSTLSFTGGSLGLAEDCTFSVTLQVPADATPGSYTNTTSDVTATAGGLAVTGPAATDDLDILGLTLAKEFTNDPVAPGETVTLRFTLDNVSATASATSIIFTDDLDATLTGLTAQGLPLANVCGAGSQIADVASTLIFTGGTLTPNSSCTFSVTLQVPVDAEPAEYTNTTSTVQANIDGNAEEIPPASDNLIVAVPLTFTKAFTDDPVAPGETVTLEFTITNGDEGNAATGIAFTDDLDATLSGLVATDLPQNDVCGAGSQVSGTSLLTLTGGNLAAGGSCTFSVTLQVPGGAADGDYSNTTSSLTATVDGVPQTADPATDALQILAPATTVEATLADVLIVDFNTAGSANPGDIIQYTATIVNTGGEAAEDVVFSLTPDALAPLVVGSVVASGGGGVNSGNTEGDTDVEVTIRSLQPGEESAVTIVFNVEVVDPLPGGTTEISNQGTVSGSNIADVPTDDPDTGDADDPTVTPASLNQSITVTGPRAKTLFHGQTYNITWTSQNLGASQVRIQLLDNGGKTPVWTDLAAATDNDGLFEWIVPGDIAQGAAYRIVVSAVGHPEIFGFTQRLVITPVQSLTLTAPDGRGESWVHGETVTIEWESSANMPATDQVDLWLLSLTKPRTIQQIAAATENDGSFEWLVPGGVPVGEAVVQIRHTVNRQARDRSRRFFVTAEPISITVTSPAAATVWQAGQVEEITWTSTGLQPTSPIRIQLRDLAAAGRTIVVTGTENDGVFEWPVPVDLPAGSTYEVGVESPVSVLAAGFSPLFEIASAAPPRQAMRVDGASSPSTEALVLSRIDVEADREAQALFLESLSWEEVSEEGATAGELPSAYGLSGSYPNPFNPQAVIEYALPEGAEVRLAVYDALGREVAVLVDGRLEAGVHRAVFEAGGLPSGVYLYRLETPAGVFTGTATLVK